MRKPPSLKSLRKLAVAAYGKKSHVYQSPNGTVEAGHDGVGLPWFSVKSGNGAACLGYAKSLLLLECLRNSPSFAAIVSTIEVDRDEFLACAECDGDGSTGDEARRAKDLGMLLELLDGEVRT